MAFVWNSRWLRFCDWAVRFDELCTRQIDYLSSVHIQSADALRTTAILRARMHAGNAEKFKNAYDRHYVGLKGEEAFSIALMPVPMPYLDQPCGDNGEDFWVTLFTDEGKSFEPFSVDVKTSRHAWSIIVPKGKVRADIYVLAQYDDETDTAELKGWQWGAVVRKAPVKTFPGGKCHCCTAIRPLHDLAFNTFHLWENGPPIIPEKWKAVHLVRSH